MSRVDFTLTYDGPALRDHQMNVRDLAPAMLAVGEAFEALNSLYNGKATQIAVNVRAHEPGCFSIAFDVVQAAKDATDYLAGTGVSSALNLVTILFGGTGVGVAGGLIMLIRRLRGRRPDRIEKLSPGMFRLFIGDETYDVPAELLQAYQELRIRRAVEGFIAKPLQKPGITDLVIASGRLRIEQVKSIEAPLFKAPEPDTDIVIDDERRAAYTIRDLSFDEDGAWRLFDGSNPIKARIEDPLFLAQVENDEIRFAKHDVLVCLVHFVQKRTGRGLENEYTVREVIDYIPAPRQLRFPEPEEGPSDEDPSPSP